MLSRTIKTITMRKFFLFLCIVLAYSCTTDDSVIEGDKLLSRSVNEEVTYHFETVNSSYSGAVYNYQGGAVIEAPTIFSYQENSDGSTVDLASEVLNKPSWVNAVDVRQVYYKYSVVMVTLNENTGAERTGVITIKQAISNETLSFNITQRSQNNIIQIVVSEVATNHYKITATTTYPVQGNLVLMMPFTGYNSGGELTHNVRIEILDGTTTSSWEINYTGSPLLSYGNIEGYRLQEGTITKGANDIHNYSFQPYW